MLWLTLRRLRSSNLMTRDQAVAEAVRRRNIDALLAVIDDQDEYLRSRAIRGLGEIADARAVPSLIKRLEDTNFNNQEDAAAALAKIGDGRAVAPLVTMMRSEKTDPQARRAGATALIALADPRAIGGLLEALRDRDDLSRALALYVIASIGDGKCVPGALAALHDPSNNVRWNAVSALGALGDARATQPLLEMLATDSGKSNLLLEDIIDALAQIGDSRADSAMAVLLTDHRHEIRKAAVRALNATGWRPPDLTAAARRLFITQQWDELADLGWSAAREPLRDAFESPDRQFRMEAITAATHFDAVEALDMLLEATADNDETNASAAAKAVAERGDPRGLHALIDYGARYAPEGGYRNNPSAPYMEQRRADQWLEPLKMLLKKVAPQLPVKTLRQLASTGDKEFGISVEYDTPGYGYGSDDYVIKLNYAGIRRRAERELERRNQEH